MSAVCRSFAALILCVILLCTACDNIPETDPLDEATPFTPRPSVVGALVPTAAILPVLPTAGDSTLQARLEYTPGVNTTVTAAATLSAIPLNISVGDITFSAEIYRSANAAVPLVLLLHGKGETREIWGDLPLRLQAVGFTVVTVDWRGAGRTGGAADWDRAPDDLREVLNYLRALPGLSAARTVLVGSGAGATLAIVGCASDANCKGAVAINAQVQDGKLLARDALGGAYGKRPLLLLTSVDDDPSAVDSQVLLTNAQGEKRLGRYPGRAHGGALLKANPDAMSAIVNWLVERG